VIELDVLTYDGVRMTVGRTDDAADFAAPARPQAPASGGDRSPACARWRPRRCHPRALPAIPRRVSGYNLPSLLPEQRLRPGARAGRQRGTCVVVLEARLRLLPAEIAHAAGARLPGRLRGRRPRAGR
jgi:hypothetical protein